MLFGVVIGLAILVLLLLLIYSRINIVISGRSPNYELTSMDMLIKNSQYIALVEVGDSQKETIYDKPQFNSDFRISVMAHTNIYITLKALETYKGEFESNEITYRPQDLDVRYDLENKKYSNFANTSFEDMKAEIERYNNTPEDERELLGAGKGSIDDI